AHPPFPLRRSPCPREKIKRFPEGLTALKGAYIINDLIPYFFVAPIFPLSPATYSPSTRHILSMSFFPIFDCHYSLSNGLFQGPWTGYFIAASNRLESVSAPWCGKILLPSRHTFHSFENKIQEQYYTSPSSNITTYLLQ